MLENLDFGKGVSKQYIDFNINKDIPLEEQMDLLKEDLVQVIYDDGYIIDMGWYPEFSEDGSFRVCVIKDYQWDNPLVQKSCRDLNSLVECICICINLIQTKSR